MQRVLGQLKQAHEKITSTAYIRVEPIGISSLSARTQVTHFSSYIERIVDMKTIIWSLFILTLTVWTGMTLLTVHLVDWIAQSFGTTLPNDLGAFVNTIPVPPWLALWIDPAWIQTIQSGLLSFIEGVTQTVPYFASAIDWLNPLIWAIWALGALALLILTIVGHWLVNSLLTTRQN